MWVIERFYLGTLYFWNARGAGKVGRSDRALRGDGWTTDFSNAVKFADAESADVVLCRLCDGQGRTAEHSLVST